MRLSMWPNANFIRYTMAHDLKEPGSVRFTHLIEVGLTKEGESLARDRPARRSAQVHRDRRRRHDDPHLSGPHVPDLLLGLQGRIQRKPREIHQESQPDGPLPAAKSKTDQPAASR